MSGGKEMEWITDQLSLSQLANIKLSSSENNNWNVLIYFYFRIYEKKDNISDIFLHFTVMFVMLKCFAVWLKCRVGIVCT